jgi:predicted dehydrogenase
MEIVSSSGRTTHQFEAVNPYRKEVEDFITLLKGGTSVGNSIEEACRSVRALEAITGVVHRESGFRSSSAN